MIRLAANAMTTLDTMKIVLSLSEGDLSYDPFLTLLINYASSWLERITGRSFGLRRRTEDATGSGQQELVLAHYPIRFIHSIVDKETGATLEPDAYSITPGGEIGVVYKDSGWSRKAYPTGLVPDFVHAKRYLAVDYTAGYVLPKDVTDETNEEWILPGGLEGIVWQAAAQELALAESGADGLAAFSISDVSWTFDKNPRPGWLDIIAAYKKVV